MKILQLAARYTRAFGLVYLCLYVGQLLVRALSIPLPGSIIGMVVLFFALVLRIFPEEWLAPACNLLLNYMALLFVPVSVGVMRYYPQVASALVPIVVACVVSSLLVLLVVALGMEYFERKTLDDKEKHDVV
ncbi:MAG: CidA/LrgA family protein [Neisseria sp.]|nr:CidA/LrgA family protein [Neisseria sp.]